METHVDRTHCAGHGLCIVLAPDSFDLDDEGLSVPIRRTVEEQHRDAVLRAVSDCPEHALTTSGE